MRKKYPVFKISLNILVILTIFFSVKIFLQRDLAEGHVPSLVGVMLNGQNIDIEYYQGKPLLLHFWATWCGICKLEEKSVSSIAEDYQVLTVSMQSGDAHKVQSYLDERGVNFPVIVDEYGEIAKRFGVNRVPASFIIDPQGKIAFTEVGYTSSWGLRLRLWLADK